MKEETKELLKAMYDMADNAENCISLLQTAFIYNSPKPLKGLRVKCRSNQKGRGCAHKKKLQNLHGIILN